MASGRISGFGKTTVILDASQISSSSGSVMSGSAVRFEYNQHALTCNIYIRIQNPNDRPTITVSGLPSGFPEFARIGAPSHARIGTTNSITDACIINHTENETTMTITFFNFIGHFPSGSGYLVTSDDFTVLY